MLFKRDSPLPKASMKCCYTLVWFEQCMHQFLELKFCTPSYREHCGFYISQPPQNGFCDQTNSALQSAGHEPPLCTIAQYCKQWWYKCGVWHIKLLVYCCPYLKMQGPAWRAACYSNKATRGWGVPGEGRAAKAEGGRREEETRGWVVHTSVAVLLEHIWKSIGYWPPEEVWHNDVTIHLCMHALMNILKPKSMKIWATEVFQGWDCNWFGGFQSCWH